MDELPGRDGLCGVLFLFGSILLGGAVFWGLSFAVVEFPDSEDLSGVSSTVLVGDGFIGTLFVLDGRVAGFPDKETGFSERETEFPDREAEFPDIDAWFNDKEYLFNY